MAIPIPGIGFCRLLRFLFWHKHKLWQNSPRQGPAEAPTALSAAPKCYSGLCTFKSTATPTVVRLALYEKRYSICCTNRKIFGGAHFAFVDFRQSLLIYLIISTPEMIYRIFVLSFAKPCGFAIRFQPGIRYGSLTRKSVERCISLWKIHLTVCTCDYPELPTTAQRILCLRQRRITLQQG